MTRNKVNLTLYGFLSPNDVDLGHSYLFPGITFHYFTLFFVQYFTGTATGALTYTFIKTLEYEPRLTYGRLFMTMRDSIYKAQSGSGPNGAFPTNDSLQVIVWFNKVLTTFF